MKRKNSYRYRPNGVGYKKEYKDKIINGDFSLDSTEEPKHINHGTGDNENISEKEIIKKENKVKRIEPPLYRTKEFFKESRKSILVGLIVAFIVGVVGFFFKKDISQNQKILVISNEINHITKTLDELKGDGKITVKDYMNIENMIYELKLDYKDMDKNISLLTKDLEIIKEKIKAY